MIKGDRVTIRALRREDMQRWAALSAANTEVQLLVSGAWSPKPLERWEKDYEQTGSDDTTILFAIEVDGQFIGMMDLYNISWRDGVAAVGIVLYPSPYLGKGYGREALRLLSDYAFRVLNLRRLWLWTQNNNERAVRSYRACGFVVEGLLRQEDYTDGKHLDGLVMGLLRSEWAAMNEVDHA